MYHHTVLLQLDPGFDAQPGPEFDRLAGDVIAQCDGVVVYAMRRNEAPSHGPYEHALFSVFTTRQSFRDYDRSELHGRVKALLAPHVVSLVVADGEVPRG